MYVVNSCFNCSQGLGEGLHGLCPRESEAGVTVSQGRLDHSGEWTGPPAGPAYLTAKVTVMYVGSRARLPGLAFHIPTPSLWTGLLAFLYP